MFICTFNETKYEELKQKGFRMICKQYRGDRYIYTFEFKPSFFALFDKDDREDIFISNKITMA